MTCNTERLSEYLDDELSPVERQAVDVHLVSCADCRAVLTELALVKDTAASLRDEPSLPAVDPWPQVEWRMQGRRARRGISLSWPQALAASVALVAVSSGVMWIAMRDRVPAAPVVAEALDTGPEVGEAVPVTMPDFADAAYESAVRDLRESLDAGRNRLDPQTIQVLEKNLAAIDQAIDQARKALEADPANVSLSSYLASVRRRKLDLLRTASDLLQPTL